MCALLSGRIRWARFRSTRLPSSATPRPLAAPPAASPASSAITRRDCLPVSEPWVPSFPPSHQEQVARLRVRVNAPGEGRSRFVRCVLGRNIRFESLQRHAKIPILDENINQEPRGELRRMHPQRPVVAGWRLVREAPRVGSRSSSLGGTGPARAAGSAASGLVTRRATGRGRAFRLRRWPRRCSA